MKLNTFALLLSLTFAAPALAAERPEIVLWPQGMPEPIVPVDQPEKFERGADGIGRRSNVSQPRLAVFEPPAEVKRSGAAAIVVPGGGFGILADEHEGSEACEWLAKQGIVGLLLEHRAPTKAHEKPHLGPAQDLQRAVSEVRTRAEALKIDPKKVGVLGFSAGGQVTLIASTNERLYPGYADGLPHMPDFMLLIYAYKIYDPATKALRSEIKVDAGLPPTFIAQAGDDGGSLPQGSTLLFLELINRKIPAEIHIYERGGHGFGMRARPGATGPSDWPLRAADWLNQHKLSSK